MKQRVSHREGKQNLVESGPLHLASAGYRPLSCNSRFTSWTQLPQHGCIWTNFSAGLASTAICHFHFRWIVFCYWRLKSQRTHKPFHRKCHVFRGSWVCCKRSFEKRWSLGKHQKLPYMKCTGRPQRGRILGHYDVPLSGKALHAPEFSTPVSHSRITCIHFLLCPLALFFTYFSALFHCQEFASAAARYNPASPPPQVERLCPKTNFRAPCWGSHTLQVFSLIHVDPVNSHKNSMRFYYLYSLG